MYIGLLSTDESLLPETTRLLMFSPTYEECLAILLYSLIIDKPFFVILLIINFS